MGASGSTRRIIVEEDEKQGAFLVQVSDSVTKQIYGIKESEGKAAKKPVDPIQKAVEAAPAVKPALPIQAFPAIPLGSPTPPLTPPPKAAVAAAGSEAKAEEKPTPADAAAAAAETEDKKPEDHVAPEAAAQEEKKPVEEMPPTSPPEGSAAAESSFDQGPVPPPKIPRSALLQLLSPSPSPALPTESKGPTEKESPPEKKAPALATPDKALYEEREMLYKQMGEVYRERDKALKAIEDFYREKMNALQNQSTKMHSATRQEFNKAVEEVEKKFLKHVEAPVCEDLQLKVLECYRTNKTYPLNCSSEVQAFSSAVDQARQNVILAKKG